MLSLLLAVYVDFICIALHSVWLLVLDSLKQGSATAQWKMKAQFRFRIDCLMSWATKGANMDTLNFILCHHPSANTQTAGGKLGLRSALSSGMPDSIQAKTHSVLSNFEFTQKRSAIKLHSTNTSQECNVLRHRVDWKSIANELEAAIAVLQGQGARALQNMCNMYKLAGKT